MATARLGGFSPQIGFFAFIAGSLGFAMVGSNRFLSCGADSTITPIFAGGLVLMAASGSPNYHGARDGAGAAGWRDPGRQQPVPAGLDRQSVVDAGDDRLSRRHLRAHPGFANARRARTARRRTGRCSSASRTLARHLGEANIYTVCIGLGVLAIVAGSETLSAKIPGALIGLIAATGAVIYAGLEHKGVNVVGTVPATLPTPSFPDISPEQWVKLLPLAFLIAIVVMVQTAATTRSFPSDPDKPADVDRDFLGAGAGSILAGLFGAFPVDASPPRTGIVSETGGRTQLSGLFAAAIILALLAFGATLLQHVPNAALGGVLLFVALRIIRVKQIVTIYRQSLGEFLLVVATAAAIIVLPIEQGVAVGIALSLLHGIWTTTRARLVPVRARAGYHDLVASQSECAGRTQS